METYQELRAAGKAMHAKALESTKGAGFDAVKIARRMNLPMSGRTLIFDNESVQNAFCDFWFHEYLVGGKSLAENVDPVKAGLTALEAKVLQAHLQTRTSLFQTEECVIAEHKVRLRDLLDPAQPDVLLTDFGLSDSLDKFRVPLALFLRLLTVSDVSMSSGFFFGFRDTMVPGLVRAYRQELKFVSPADLPQKRFIFFFKAHCQLGIEQEYQDVV